MLFYGVTQGPDRWVDGHITKLRLIKRFTNAITVRGHELFSKTFTLRPKTLSLVFSVL